MLFQRPHHHGHKPLRVGGFAAALVFAGSIYHGKQRQIRYAKRHAALGHRQQQIKREPRHAWHGGNFFAPLLAFEYKHGVNQIVGAQAVLAHQIAGKRIAAQAARATLGVRGVGGSHGE